MNDDRNNRNRVLEKAMPDIRASIRILIFKYR